MIRTGVESPATAESVVDAAVRKINVLEKQIVRSEDDADARLWEQAGGVVALLDGGLTQRALAKQWINVRTGEAYSQSHVAWTAKAFEQSTVQPRPRFRDVYNALANTGKTNRLLAYSGNNEWYTPPEFTRAAAEVMGEIELDPASSAIANETVGAAVYYTSEDDGLTKDWPGRVWVNPPYSQPLISRFCAKLVEQYMKGVTTEACVLVNNSTDTAWFQALLQIASAVCFPEGRVRFRRPNGEYEGTALQGQAVIYLGADADSFAKHFAVFGVVLRHHYGCQLAHRDQGAA